MTRAIAAVVALGLVASVVAGRLLEDPDIGTATWDAARAAGFTTYLLLWAAAMSGMAVHLRLRPGGTSLGWLLEAHRITSTLALSFLTAHLVSLLLDPVVTFRPWEVAVPLLSDYRPVPVAMGILAAWLLVIVLVTTLASGRMPYATWRRLHMLAFQCYVLALVHGLTAGSDAGQPLALAIYGVTASAFAALSVLRMAGRGWVDAGEVPLQP